MGKRTLCIYVEHREKHFEVRVAKKDWPSVGFCKEAAKQVFQKTGITLTGPYQVGGTAVEVRRLKERTKELCRD